MKVVKASKELNDEINDLVDKAIDIMRQHLKDNFGADDFEAEHSAKASYYSNVMLMAAKDIETLKKGAGEPLAKVAISFPAAYKKFLFEVIKEESKGLH